MEIGTNILTSVKWWWPLVLKYNLMTATAKYIIPHISLLECNFTLLLSLLYLLIEVSVTESYKHRITIIGSLYLNCEGS